MSFPISPHVVVDVDDDDAFDWEAAVREIDVACKGTSSTKATAATFGSDSSLSRPNPKKPRQSTLDRFVKPMNHSKQVVVDAYENDNERGDANARCYCQVDLEAAKTWIYPVNIPLRDYQLSITKTALFTNTLVALPTGLGKTFIAAVVMYNYFRWFPEGKIVFTAPSRPLVLQQIEACHNIVGIPQEWAIDLTGQTSPSKRACLWEAKRVFFVTPQVLEKDIQSGTFSKKHLVCLVIDEAHRALGNYSYCVAVRELMAVQLQFRILALTATPGSKQQTIQKVIDNLQISKLEYRNDTDHDVIPYVHNRKLELIKVAMGKDAIEISDKLLEAIRPFVVKLSSFGVPLNRDVQMLSPCDLLNTRDKFRQAPPQDLSHVKYGEVEGCFGALITLYHIRKLLSSHGIKPAYEMLEEKLQQGSFARLMTRNEVIWKTKLLMQQSLSHGAPNPKLLKMTEILVDHFKQNDPKNSRVIIFSNFRGSVRDIMSTLSSIGESVKATEFIGQSSGKNLKGQTQKIQQAVLQKFRTGGYNIIVATSIGEEGLDIMEVDLVICFDANISPLRMIQRMGRTGRKHDGRVVVLACEGSEIKGYMRKQANSKAVSKHMRNGGINSFDFHSSPRMIPHICKPDVHFVKFSIEQFVPRGKKVKDDLINDHSFKDKLSNDEADLIAKYFPSSRENTWKSSLIAFPHFQSFPSSVYHVMHSFRTRMLIGTMQHLQAQSFPVDSKAVPLKVRDNFSSNECMEANNLTRDTKDEMGSLHDIPGQHPEKKATEAEAWGTVISSCTEKCDMSDSSNRNLTMHCFLFEAVYVSVKPSGAVSISSVPSLPFVKEAPLCKSKAENNTEQLNTVKHNYSTSVTSAGDNCELKHNLTNPAESNGAYDHFMSNSLLSNSNAHEKPVLDEVENIPSTPSPKKNYMDSEVIIVDTPVSTVRNVPVLLANIPTGDIKDVEMSPRLTNMIEEGVVPESPLGEMVDHSLNENTVHSVSSLEHVNGGLFANCSRKVHGNKISKDSALQSDGLPMCELRRQLLFPLNVPFGFHNSPSLINLSSKKSESGKECKNAGALGDVCDSPINKDIHTPLIKMHSCSNAREGVCGSPNNGETRTPLVNLTNSCSNDWHLSSGSKSIQQSPKFRRLRKYRDSSNTIKKDLTAPMSNVIKSTTRTNPEKRIKSKRKMVSEAKLFIDEEAEVSSDAQVSSDDEEEDDDKDSNDGSFIDDRINPTMENTQAEAIRSDMMAIYRRSLLSQSPMESPLCRSTNLHSSGIQCTTVTDETGSCSSGKISHSLQTPQTGIQSAVRSSNLCVMDSVGNPQINMASESSVAPKEEKKIENRKRKLSFHQFGYDPETSLQPQRLFHSESTANTSLQCQPENIKHNEDVFYDDQFYEGLDLDALEAQATVLLKNKSELLIDRRQSVVPELSHSPSFDLGI